MDREIKIFKCVSYLKVTQRQMVQWMCWSEIRWLLMWATLRVVHRRRCGDLLICTWLMNVMSKASNNDDSNNSSQPFISVGGQGATLSMRHGLFHSMHVAFRTTLGGRPLYSLLQPTLPFAFTVFTDRYSEAWRGKWLVYSYRGSPYLKEVAGKITIDILDYYLL